MSNKLEFTGRLVAKFNQREGVSEKTGKDWNTIEFLVEETGTQYPQKAVFSCFNDKCDLIEKINIGTEIKVSFNIKANAWKNGYIGKNDVWKVEKMSGAKNETTETKVEPNVENLEDDEDLPF